MMRGLASRCRLIRSSDRRWHPWVYGFVLALWASSWNLRLSVLMAWMPVEPVRVASVAVGACVVHRCGQPFAAKPRAAGVVILLTLGFVPGVLESGASGYAPEKVSTLVLVVLPVVLAAAVLLDSREARQGWVWSQLAVGLFVVAASITTSHETLLQPGRFSLATVNTVSTGRLVGVAFVVLLLIAAATPKHLWWSLPVAVGCGMVLVQVGSRGPLLFALIAVAICIVGGRFFAGQRERLLFIAAAAAVASFAYAVLAGGEGGRRVATSLREGLVDPIRARLLHDAFQAGAQHPWGVGWGDFLDYSATARYIANDQGVSYAHNAFAEAFAEGGLLALLSFAAFAVVAVVRLRRVTLDRWDAIVWGTLVYWMLNALVSLDFVGNRFMWIALACGLAAVPAPGAGHPPQGEGIETEVAPSGTNRNVV